MSDADESDMARDTEDGDQALARIQELFHGLIRSRCREGGLDIPPELPQVTTLTPNGQKQYFAVPGMTGGFSFHLGSGPALSLKVSSWCRVVEGSGMRHVITPTQVILEEEGFS